MALLSRIGKNTRLQGCGLRDTENRLFLWKMDRIPVAQTGVIGGKSVRSNAEEEEASSGKTGDQGLYPMEGPDGL